MASNSQPLGFASAESARSFAETIELGGPETEAPFAASDPRLQDAQPASVARPATGTDPAGLNLRAGADQGVVVGSQLLSFSSDVTGPRRAAAINSCLLAQLRASKLNPSPDTPEAARAWHASYVNTLINLGWVLQSGVTAAQSTGTQHASVDQVLLEVVGTLLGGGAAVALATKVIQAIATAKRDDPMIVLYQSRVVEQRAVEFGAGLGSGSGDGFMLSVVECTMSVRSDQEQFLFFKWNADSAHAEGRRFDFGIADAVYAAAQPLIEQKVAPFVRNFVATLDI